MRVPGRTGTCLNSSGPPSLRRGIGGSQVTSVLRDGSGFTLLEVLVVVAILGVISAVVVMNIAGFSGSGAVDAANTEAHQVNTATVAYMQAHSVRTWNGIVGDGSEQSQQVEEYLLDPGRLQARYTVSDGKIVDAFAFPDGRWSNCVWDTQDGVWRVAE